MYASLSRAELARVAKEYNIAIPTNTIDLAYRVQAFEEGTLPQVFLTTYDAASVSPSPTPLLVAAQEPRTVLSPDLLGIGSNLTRDVLFPFLAVPDLFALRKVCKLLYDKSTECLRKRATICFGAPEYLLFTRVIPRVRQTIHLMPAYAVDEDAIWENAVTRVRGEYMFNERSIQQILDEDARRKGRDSQKDFRRSTREQRAAVLHPTLLGWNGEFVTFDGVPVKTTHMPQDMAIICRHIRQGFNLKVTVENVLSILESYSQSHHFIYTREKWQAKMNRKRK